jgi:LysR family hydrogen peroxide-inducible transcriptional activator
MVASGVGVSVMPATAVDAIGPRDPLLRVRPFADPPPVRRVGLAWRRTFPRQRVIEVVQRAIVACRLPGTITLVRAGAR